MLKKTVLSSQVCLNSWAICFNIDLITYGATIKWKMTFFVVISAVLTILSGINILPFFTICFHEKWIKPLKRSLLFFYDWMKKKIVKIYSLTKLSGKTKSYITIFWNKSQYGWMKISQKIIFNQDFRQILPWPTICFHEKIFLVHFAVCFFSWKQCDWI